MASGGVCETAVGEFVAQMDGVDNLVSGCICGAERSASVVGSAAPAKGPDPAGAAASGGGADVERITAVAPPFRDGAAMTTL
jgi:hypothetical protein